MRSSPARLRQTQLRQVRKKAAVSLFSGRCGQLDLILFYFQGFRILDLYGMEVNGISIVR